MLSNKNIYLSYEIMVSTHVMLFPKVVIEYFSSQKITKLINLKNKKKHVIWLRYLLICTII